MENQFSIQNSSMKLWDKLDGWLEAIILKLPNIAMAIVVMFVFYVAARLIRKLFRKVLLRKISQISIQEIISKVVFMSIILLGFFIALSVLELDKVLTSILAGAGIVGLAVGLALQGTLSNTFGGLVLSFMPNIKINDWIENEDTSGFVTEISLRNIVVKKADNNFVIIPNSKFINGSFTNYSLSERSRVTVNCGVGYESKLQEVEDLTIKILNENFEQKEDEKVEFFFTEFGDSSINFIVRFWVDLAHKKHEHEARHKAVKAIKEAFDKKNINIPFPIRTLDFGKNSVQVTMNESKSLK